MSRRFARFALLLLLPNIAAPFKFSRPTLRLRGGAISAASLLLATAGADAAAAASPSYHLTNCAAGAAAFFGNVRIPAALLTGAAIGQLWTNVDDKRGGKKVPVIFTCLVAASVACELLVVFISTAISTKMMGSAFDPMATSPLALLMREFELPFIACRVHFFMGLLSFVGALGLRAWATFPGHLGNGLAMLMLSAILLMNQIFNYTVDNFQFGLLGLIARYMQLFAEQVVFTPLGGSATAALCAAGYFFVQAAIEKKKDA